MINPPYCGNGIKDPGDQCDDGNYESGDGCSSSCNHEGGFNCAVTNNYTTTVCFPNCGDGALVKGEECDDDNNISGDGCSANC